jgi:hypothetical protein
MRSVSRQILVLPSPFLGSHPYRPLATALTRLGHAAEVARCPDGATAEALIAAWTAQAGPSTLLVPHSNAGYLAPLVGREAGDIPILFMDAALPPASGRFRLAPDALRRFLAEMVDDDGRLPRWTDWWSPDELADVLPGGWREYVATHAPRVPLSYLDSEVAAPPGWSEGKCAYLAFGRTYADELDFALRCGWPTEVLLGEHLHCTVEADDTAAAVTRLAQRLPTPSN